MRFLQEYVDLMRSYLDEMDQESDWDDSELVKYISNEQNFLATKIRKEQQDFFGKRFIFPIVDGQIEYFLPYDIISPRFVEMITTGVSGTAPNYIVDEKNRTFSEIPSRGLSTLADTFATTTGIRRLSTERYTVFDEKMIFTPGNNLNGYIRIWYIKNLPSLHYGEAISASSSTLVLNATPTEGVLAYGDDVYNGMLLGIYSGTGKGQVRRIVQYTDATQTCTIDQPWTVTPDATSVYSIISPIPEQMGELLVLGGAIRATGKMDDSSDKFVMLYSSMSKEFLNEINPRVRQGVRRVRSRASQPAYY